MTVAAATKTALPRPRRRWSAERIAAGVIGAYAIGALTSLYLLLIRHGRRTSLPEILLGLLGIPTARSFVSLVVLVLLTGALVRRKRVAWAIVMVFEVVSLLWSLGVVAGQFAGRLSSFPVHLHHVPGSARLLEGLGVVVSALLIGLLWRARSAFPARLERGSWWVALLTFVLGTAASLISTRLIVARLSDTSLDNERVLARLAILWSLGLDDLGSLPRRLQWVPELTGLLLSATIVATVVLFFRSRPGRVSWTPGLELAVRDLVARYGGQDSLSYFATRRDKIAVFSADGQACVSYAVFGSVALASSDPVGARDSWADAIARWKELARTNGWLPAVVSASEAGARAYAAAGLNVVGIGDEAVIHADQFLVGSPSLTAVRHAASHARRAGAVVEVRRQRDLAPAELDRLSALAQEWRAGAERGFSMTSSRYADPSDGGNTLVVARIGHDPVAMLSFVPWGKRGLSLDEMRRGPQAPNGAVELMVSELLRQGERGGLQRISLNFAVMRQVFADAERLGAPVGARAGATFLGVLDRYFQLESLYRSNAKYNPEWVPRYVCFDGPASLPRTAVAIARAEGHLGNRRMPMQQLSPEDAAVATELQFRPIHVDETAPAVPEQTRIRLAHRDELRAAGRMVGVGQATPQGLAQLPDESTPALVAGRVCARRHLGGVLFLELSDVQARRQVIFERDRCPAWDTLVRAVDLGDLVIVRARAGLSRTGTPSLLAEDWCVSAKSLHPVPFRGFTDPDARARNRSLDLIVHPQDAQVLRARSLVVSALRRQLLDEDFREVETPILGTTHGGATARPFRTYINAYNASLYLRIAPELALKRLIVAGSGPIFELARNFRNEGADASHNPEFTSLEAYLPYGDYHTMRELTERLIRAAASAVHGSPMLPLRQPDGTLQLTDVSAPWPVVSVTDAVSAAVGETVSLETDFDHLVELAGRYGIELGPEWGPGAIIEELYGELVEKQTVFPTFYVDFPVETSPLTGPHRSIPGLTERWDLVANGMELGTAYSELVDPVEQRRRLTAQSLKAAAGDAEAMEVDEDFLRALELGMPPTGGLGLGVDRIVMLVTGTQIRDVLTFPFVRPAR